MRLEKFEHACFTVEKNSQTVVVDPGEFSNDFVAPSGVLAVVITHQHADHFDEERLADIFAANDDVLILGPADVIEQVEIENKRAVLPGETITIGPFELEFFGGEHALIHDSLPRPQNIGVLINSLVYYPGDSLVVPTKSVDTLAIPAVAPWLTIGEAMDFLSSIRPRLAFPTHDAIASDTGKSVVDRLLSTTATSYGGIYQRLDTAIEI